MVFFICFTENRKVVFFWIFFGGAENYAFVEEFVVVLRSQETSQSLRSLGFLRSGVRSKYPKNLNQHN